MKYEIITYDVWGNACDGFSVNDAFHTGRLVEVPDDATDYLINRRLGVRGVVWDWRDTTIYGELRRNGRPALELRLVD